MASPACRGQVVTEVIWLVLLIFGFTVFVTNLYQSAAKAHQKPRWELRKDGHKWTN